MLDLAQLVEQFHGQRAADPVGPRLDDVQVLVGQRLEGGVGDDDVAAPHAGRLGHVELRRDAEVHEEVVEVEDLLAVLVLEFVRRFGADHAQEVPLAGAHHHALPQQHVRPPAAERTEAQVPGRLDVGHHEPDLVHVAGDHDARGLAGPLLGGDERPDVVAPDLAELRRAAAQDRRHVVLEARGAERLAKLLQKRCPVAHADLLRPSGHRRSLRESP
jgi:hypothetical protein